MQNSDFNHIGTYIISPHFSTKLYRSQFNYITKHYGERMFDEVCTELKVSKEYLLSDDNWISADFNRDFANRLIVKTGDKELFRKIGQQVLMPENINPLEFYLLKIASASWVIENFNFYISKVNQLCKAEISKVGLGHYNIRVRIKSPYTLYDDIIHNFQGSIESFGKFYDLKNYSVVCNRSMNNDYADFVVRFSGWREYLKKILRIVICLGVGFLLAAGIAKLNANLSLILTCLIFTIFIVCLYLLSKAKDILHVIEEYNQALYESSMQKNYRLRQTVELAERKEKEARILGSISQDFHTRSDIGDAIKRCANEVHNKFKYDQIAVLLLDRSHSVLKLFYSVGMVDRSESCIEYFDVANSLFWSVLNNRKGQLVSKFEGEFVSSCEQQLLGLLAGDSLLVSPIQSMTGQYGVFAVSSRGNSEDLKSDDQTLIDNIANMLGLLFENEEYSTNSRQVAHDIRSPLSVLNMLLPSLNSIEREEKLELARLAVNRVTDIAEDLLRRRNQVRHFVQSKRKYRLNPIKYTP